MKILLANKFYYSRGGDCVVTINLERLLVSKGHDVAVFSMDFPENLSSAWERYWPSNMTSLKAFTRPFGDSEVIKKFTRLIEDFKPDVVHLHNVHTQLSPVIAKISHEHGIRVVWTLHDTKLVCPCYTCTRNGVWCTECFTDKKAVIKHRCMPGNIVGAIIGYLEAKKWNIKKLCEYTDVFLAPSRFIADTCIAGGYPREIFTVLCNFINVEKIKNSLSIVETNNCESKNSIGKNYYVFLGRVTEVKGIRTLCAAASKLPYKLIVIGGGDLLEELKPKYPDILFLGQKNWEELKPIIKGANFMVLPSEWSENNPLTIIEALSLGTPVLGARIGGIPELIDENVTGMTFTSGDVEDLEDKIQKMWTADFDNESIAKKAVELYSSETYYDKLMEIYKGQFNN